MRIRRLFVVALVFAGAVCAQTPEDELRSKIHSIRYAPLGEWALIQGDVHLSVKSGVVTLRSGHPILATKAVEATKAFGSIQGKTDLDVIYHFVLGDTTTSVAVSTTVPRGNAFERAVLRLFRLKTEKVVLDHQCQEGPPPANNLKIAGTVIEIWVFGRIRCLQAEAGTLVAKR